MGIAIAGPMVMSLADGSGNSLLALLKGGCAALAFGVSNYVLKLGSARGIRNEQVVTTLVCTMGVFGVLGLIYSAIGRHGLPGLTGKFVFFAAASGVLWAVAKVFFQRALGGLAAPASAIVNTNSLGVLVLQIIVFGQHVETFKVVGMFLCILGVCVLSFAPAPQPSRTLGQELIDPGEKA